MTETTIIGGPFAGVLQHEAPLPLCGVIHLTVMEEIPDMSKGDQHAELHRGMYQYSPETNAFHYTSIPTPP